MRSGDQTIEAEHFQERCFARADHQSQKLPGQHQRQGAEKFREKCDDQGEARFNRLSKYVQPVVQVHRLPFQTQGASPRLSTDVAITVAIMFECGV